MNNKMSNWFKLPVNCLLVEELNGENKDAIQFENVNILTSHHVQKVEMAINEYDRLVRLDRLLTQVRDDNYGMMVKTYYKDNSWCCYLDQATLDCLPKDMLVQMLSECFAEQIN